MTMISMSDLKENNQDGDGVWVETVGWTRNADGTYTGITTQLDPTTLPHVIISTALNTFVVAPCDGAQGFGWHYRCITFICT